MTKDIYREDDLLSDFGTHLTKYGFLILALSGNQQGQYWFPIGAYRKAPDIIAVRKDIVLVGEAKVRSRELFKSKNGRQSDYQSLKYLMDNVCAKEYLSQKIMASLSRLGQKIDKLPPIQTIVVGGDPFADLQNEMDDDRIWYFTVDKANGDIKSK